MKYFTENNFADNKEMYRLLSKRYHPDSPTGNEDMMKEINAEWELYRNTPAKETKSENNPELHEDMSSDEKFVMYMGIRYTGEPKDVCERVAMRFGGMALQEFVNSKEYKDYCDNYEDNG